MPGNLTLIGDKAPPAARESSEVARALNQHCYLHTGNVWHNWSWSSSLSLLVVNPIRDEAMDVAWSAPHRAQNHADDTDVVVG